MVLASIFILVVSLVALVIITFSERQRRERLENRCSMTGDQIYDRFFASRGFPKELVLELWDEIATVVQLPAGLLRPTDRFDEELAPLEGADLWYDYASVHAVAERRMDKCGFTGGSSQIKSVGDYIEFFCDPDSRRNMTCGKRRPRLVRQQ